LPVLILILVTGRLFAQSGFGLMLMTVGSQAVLQRITSPLFLRWFLYLSCGLLVLFFAVYISRYQVIFSAQSCLHSKR
jgi:multisubunit Na+/H+ antiporter MnhB subunit